MFNLDEAMIMRNVFFVGCTFFSAQTMAFPCYFTLVKDSCWIDYSVTVTVMDVSRNTSLLSINVPKGQSWGRQTFTCQPGQKIVYQATFEPTIWQGSEGHVYNALRYWSLPSAISPKDKAWEVSVCYPKAFSEVPLPPAVSGNCKCNFKTVTPIPLQTN